MLAARTDGTFKGILVEIVLPPKVFSAVEGDINSDTENLRRLLILLNEHFWTDVGAVASRWGGVGA